MAPPGGTSGNGGKDGLRWQFLCCVVHDVGSSVIPACVPGRIVADGDAKGSRRYLEGFGKTPFPIATRRSIRTVRGTAVVGSETTQLRNVALQIGAHKVGAPSCTRFVIARPEGVRSTATDPKMIALASNLESVQPGWLVIGRTPSQRFGRLSKQTLGCGAEKQELSAALASRAPLVNLSAQDLKQIGHSLNLVKDQHPFALSVKIQLGIRQAGSLVGILEIEIHAVRNVSGDFAGERGPAHLPRPEQNHRGCFRRAANDRPLVASLNHPC